MNRLATGSIALTLFALMAVAGLPGSGDGLLMVSPFLALLLPLLIDVYPGERVLKNLISLLDAFSSRRAVPAGVRPASSSSHRPGVCVAGPVGPRGPPPRFA